MTITKAYAEHLIREGQAEPVLGDQENGRQAIRRLDLGGRIDHYPLTPAARREQQLALDLDDTITTN